MDKEFAIRTLKEYERELGEILSRFHRMRNGIHIEKSDDPRFRQIVTELEDLFRDTIGKDNNYTEIISAHFQEAIANWTGSPSYKSVENIKGVVAAALVRLQRNLDLIEKTQTPITAPTNQLNIPDRVTLAWLWKYVPFRLWALLAGIILSALFVGVSIGQLSIVKEYLGLKKDVPKLAETPHDPTANLKVFEAELQALSKAHGENVAHIQKAIVSEEQAAARQIFYNEQKSHQDAARSLRELLAQENRDYKEKVATLRGLLGRPGEPKK